MIAPSRLFSGVLAGAARPACLCVTGPVALAQNGGGADHWVGTWATAVVARPQGPQGFPQGFGPPPQAQPPQGQPQAVPPAGPEPPAQNGPAVQAGGRGGR